MSFRRWYRWCSTPFHTSEWQSKMCYLICIDNTWQSRNKQHLNSDFSMHRRFDAGKWQIQTNDSRKNSSLLILRYWLFQFLPVSNPISTTFKGRRLTTVLYFPGLDYNIKCSSVYTFCSWPTHICLLSEKVHACLKSNTSAVFLKSEGCLFIPGNTLQANKRMSVCKCKLFLTTNCHIHLC